MLLGVFRKGDMTLEHLMAFTVTNDHAAQGRVWVELPEWRRQNPNYIRAALTENEITARDLRVRFVTLKDYEKAGGALRRDLFSEGEEGVYIEDAVLLERLVAKKLEKAANGVRKEGWKWVEVRSSLDPEEWSACRRRYPERAPLSPEKQKEMDALTEEAETLAELGEMDDEQQERLDSIQERIEELDIREAVWPTETLAIAGAVVTLGGNGKAAVQHGFIRPQDAPAEPVEGVPQSNGADAKTQKGIHSAPLLESLTAHRSAALSAVLTQPPDVAFAAAVHSLASQVFYKERSEGMALQISAKVASLREVEGSPAAMFILSARERWSERFPADADQLFAWCLEQAGEALRDLLAFCVGQTVNAVLVKGDWTAPARLAHAARLHEALKLDMAAWFTPTAANYFGKIGKTAIFQSLREMNGGSASAGIAMKKSDLAALAERHVAGTGWLPEPLRTPVPPIAASEAVEGGTR
jgi:ParB family chromosome partitioning protein